MAPGRLIGSISVGAVSLPWSSIKRTIHDFLGLAPEDDATDVTRATG